MQQVRTIALLTIWDTRKPTQTSKSVIFLLKCAPRCLYWRFSSIIKGMWGRMNISLFWRGCRYICSGGVLDKEFGRAELFCSTVKDTSDSDYPPAGDACLDYPLSAWAGLEPMRDRQRFKSGNLETSIYTTFNNKGITHVYQQYGSIITNPSRVCYRGKEPNPGAQLMPQTPGTQTLKKKHELEQARNSKHNFGKSKTGRSSGYDNI